MPKQEMITPWDFLYAIKTHNRGIKILERELGINNILFLKETIMNEDSRLLRTDGFNIYYKEMNGEITYTFISRDAIIECFR